MFFSVFNAFKSGNSIINSNDFIELCRKEDYTGMLEFLDAHEIPYYKKE